jgi:hypothetical protein
MYHFRLSHSIMSSCACVVSWNPDDQKGRLVISGSVYTLAVRGFSLRVQPLCRSPRGHIKVGSENRLRLQHI